jgi:hypothetical protein
LDLNTDAGRKARLSSPSFVQLPDTGLFVPTPKDEKRVVFLVNTARNAKIKVYHETVDQAVSWLELELSKQDVDWHIMKDPVYNEDMALSLSFLAGVDNVGVEWVDVEGIRAQQEERRLAKLSGQNRATRRR